MVISKYRVLNGDFYKNEKNMLVDPDDRIKGSSIQQKVISQVVYLIFTSL